MILKKISLSEILNFLGKDILVTFGDLNEVYIDNIYDVNRVNENTLDWINPTMDNKQKIVENSNAKVILVDHSVEYSRQLQEQKKILVVVENPKVTLAKIGNHYFVKKIQPSIHPTAIIDNNAVIGRNVYIGPYCIIGKSSIGEGCIIDSNVHIFDEVELGCNCEIKSGSVLGGTGFGFEKDSGGNWFRFPQIGRLIIGDFVEIGANSTIDRGALSDTIIEDYTKINNLCHIAHNNHIGKNVVITGCVNLSGSNKIDDNVWIAPNVSVRGRIHVGEGATIGMGSVVTKNIPAGETWIGNPARKYEK